MSKSIPDPFESDSTIPEPLEGDPSDSYSFSGDEDSLAYRAPPRAAVPWKYIGIVAGIIAAFAILGGAAFFAFNFITESPDKPVRGFYDALNQENFDQAAKFVDPESPVSDPRPLVNALVEQLQALVPDDSPISLQDLNLSLGFRFRDLKYDILERQDKLARVHVTASLWIYEKNTQLGLTVPYEFTHQVVQRDGTWYIKLY